MPERPVTPPPTGRVFTIVAVAVAALLSGFQLARWTAPVSDAPQPAAHNHPVQAAPGAEVGGLAVSAGGYTLAVEQSAFVARVEQPLRLRVNGPDGAVVTSFATVHLRQMHVVVARRDLSGYQHLHPTMAPDGTWSVPLTLGAPGSWRVFADFAVAGPADTQTAVALGADLTVAGRYEPRPLPAPALVSDVDRFTVSYDVQPRRGVTVPLVFQIARDGVPVTALEPYLGAYGHLVVLRDGDVGYLHVHPDPAPVAGQAQTRFWVTLPSPGRYRMFFDFQTGGVARTAEFTVEVS